MLKQSFNLLLKTWRNSSPGEPTDGPETRSLDRRLEKKISAMIDDCLAEKGGEVSARKRAAGLGGYYLTFDSAGRRRFLQLLAERIAPDLSAIRQAAEMYLAEPESDSRLESLRRSLGNRHRQLLKQFNALPEGVHFLVNLRADLLRVMGDDPALAALDHELCGLLADWFDVGLLELRRIDWQSPAALLEKLIDYEAVHEIDSWDDLHNRLESDRRCYAFFHPGMPDEPLIFIEVALVKGISTNIQALLDTEAPLMAAEAADSAVFYSISNTQQGLRGINFGNFLIKRVVEDLRRDLPNLKNFVTLSPLPGFARWLQQLFDQQDDSPATTDFRQTIEHCTAELDHPATLQEILQRPDFFQRQGLVDLLRPPLTRLCAQYLHSRRTDLAPIDPVERFHLSNGARLEQINWCGNSSPHGLRQSAGFMVNYLYKTADIEKNLEAYAEKKKIVTSARVAKLNREP